MERGVKAPVKLTAELLKKPYSTIHKIVTQPEDTLKRKVWKKQATIINSLGENQLEEIKLTIYQMYKDKEVPTLDGFKNKLIQRGFQFNYSTESLRIILQKLEFTYKKINKRSSIMETERLRVLRTQYINEIRRYRSENRNIVYIDETWYDTHDIVKMGWVDKTNKCILDTPPSRGKRVIILNAGGKNGWVPDCLLLSARNIVNSSADYHQDMDANMFEKWFQEQLLPKLPPNSVIVMDNAAYHSRLLMKNPTKSSRKEEIIKFMEAKNINFPAKRTKVELLKAIENSNIDKTKSYVVDNLAIEKGHTVLRLPPYYCIFNAIELIWSQLKHAVRKGNRTPNLSASVVDLIRDKSNKIDAALWESCVKHVITIENSYLSNVPFSEIIIHVNDEDDSDEDDNFIIL
jgi:transposase